MLAQTLYKERKGAARPAYLALVHSYVKLLTRGATPTASDAVDNEPEERVRFLQLASQFAFALDTDYQQDKATPFWGASPQPGPTYFYSKNTNYVHILVAHCLGEQLGPSRFARLLYYIRWCSLSVA